MLTYQRLDNLEIIRYNNFDFVGCQDSMKSISDYIYMVIRGVVSWKNVKQSFIASSTMETEFIACYKAYNHDVWLWNLVMRVRIMDCIERPIKLFYEISQ